MKAEAVVIVAGVARVLAYYYSITSASDLEVDDQGSRAVRRAGSSATYGAAAPEGVCGRAAASTKSCSGGKSALRSERKAWAAEQSAA